MPLPPKGDPRRPLHLAIRSMRLLGGILLLFSTCILGMFGLRGGGRAPGATWIGIAVLLLYAIPGTAFLTFSFYLARRQFWAVVASICLASVVLLVGLMGLLAIAIAAFAEFQLPMLIPLTLALLVVLALAQLIYHLTKSFEAIRHIPPDERGFEPIMVTPLPPAEMYPQHDRGHEQG